MTFTATLIGTGNVAWHLAKALHQAAWPIQEVVGRNTRQREQLSQFGVQNWVEHARLLTKESTFCFLCVPDEAIPDVIKQIPAAVRSASILVHFSGTTGLDVFAGYASRYGCLWPIQTLVAEKPVAHAMVPVAATASDESTMEILGLAGALIGHVTPFTSDEQKKKMHLAAVMSGNFLFRMLVLTNAYCRTENLPYDMLAPLIRESVAKGLSNPTPSQQTGPAARDDSNTLLAHLQMLQEHPDQQAVYRLMTDIIQQNKQ